VVPIILSMPNTNSIKPTNFTIFRIINQILEDHAQMKRGGKLVMKAAESYQLFGVWISWIIW